MACVSTPTETLFTTITTNTVTRTFSQSVITFADTTTTILSTTCLATATVSNSTSCDSTSVITQLSTIAGGTSTTTIAVPVTETITLTEATATLFSTSCSSDTSSSSSTSTSSLPSSSTPAPSSITQSSSSNTSSSSNAVSTSSTSPSSSALSSVTVLSTPPPSIITSQTLTTLPDGSVTFTEVTLTSTLPPSSIVVPTEVGAPPQSSLSPDSRNSNNAGNDLGAIIGGVLGGFFGLLAIVGLLWYCWRRRIRLLEAFEDDENKSVPRLVRNITKSRRRQMDIDGETNPRPYQYGLVGSNTTPLSSPPLDPTQPMMHGRSPSLTPLMLSGASVSPSQPTTTTTSRPGTSGSFFPQVEDSPGAPVAMLSSRSSSNLGQERERRNSRLSLTLSSQPHLDLNGGVADATSASPGSPTSQGTSSRRPPLQVVNTTVEPPSPVESEHREPEGVGSSSPPTTPSAASNSNNVKRSRRLGDSNITVHQDGGRAGSSQNDDPPPAYSS